MQPPSSLFYTWYMDTDQRWRNQIEEFPIRFLKLGGENWKNVVSAKSPISEFPSPSLQVVATDISNSPLLLSLTQKW